MAISTSVPIFIIFLFSLHRVATEPHLPRKKNLTGIRSNIAASSDAGAKPGKSGKGGAEREEQNGRNRAYIEKTYRFRISKLNRNSDEKEQTKVSDSRQMRTKDPTSGTKAKSLPLPTKAPLAARSCAKWIQTHYLQRSSTAA